MIEPVWKPASEDIFSDFARDDVKNFKEYREIFREIFDKSQPKFGEIEPE